MAKRPVLHTIARLTPKSSRAGAAAAYARLRFNMQHQTETEWCWAAVSASVSILFNSKSTWTQCGVADVAWNRKDCCGAGSSGPCNHPWYLDRALKIVNCFDRMTNQREAFGAVKTEIAARRPLGLRVGWAIGGGHFLAIYGWRVASDGTEYYDVDDPIYGKQTIERSKLETAYKQTGRWTHSYFVKRPLAKSKSTSGGSAVIVAQPEFAEAIGG